VQLLRSHLRLPARAARVDRPSASFEVLPAGQVAMAHSAPFSLLLRQIFSAFSRFVQVRASLALRLMVRSSNGALPINKANNPDAASRAGF